MINRWPGRRLGTGVLSLLFEEKEQGSGITLFLFLRNKKQNCLCTKLVTWTLHSEDGL